MNKTDWMKVGRDRLIFSSSFALAVISYHSIFGKYFPNQNFALGHDYGYFLPNLLNGYYWYQANGLFEPPWFTPAFCGGIPFLPNPQSMYYSVPQAFTLFFDPLASVYLTYLLFASVGFVGSYVLSRRVFSLSSEVSAFAATLFMFNGFYAYRMVIGHLTYHPFMLLPTITFFLARENTQDRVNKKAEILDALFAGTMISYFVHAGALNFVIPAIISIIGLWVLASLCNKPSYVFWKKLFCAALVSLLLSFSKLISSVLFIGNFPRDMYALPGIEGISETVADIFSALFLSDFREINYSNITNTNIQYQQHSFEFGITIIPLFIIVFYLLKIIYNCIIFRKALSNESPGFEKLILVVILLLILMFPVIINYYNPVWNSFLKNLPYIKNSSSLFRWIAIDIPIIIMISAVIVKRYNLNNELAIISALICCLIGINAVRQNSFYKEQSYSPENVLYAYRITDKTNMPKEIEKIAVTRDDAGNITSPIWRNDLMVTGSSQLLCYEAIFGYELESLPLGLITTGDPMNVYNKRLNIKNPTCYLYGEENHCSPGDHFHEDEIEKARSFLKYKPFSYEIPPIQKLANYINMYSLIMLIIILVIYLSNIILESRRKGALGEG